MQCFWLALLGQRVLNKDPTVWLDGARPPQRYIFKNTKIKMAELHINNT